MVLVSKEIILSKEAYVNVNLSYYTEPLNTVNL